MTMELPDWDEMAAEPEKLVAALEEGIDGLQEEVRLMRERLKLARRLVEVKADAVHLKEHNTPRPRKQSSDLGQGRNESEDTGDGTGMTRKVQVLQLLGQDPGRRWKAAEIAELLEIDNLKSLRTSLDEFARAEIIAKNVDDKTYQAAPQQ